MMLSVEGLKKCNVSVDAFGLSKIAIKIIYGILVEHYEPCCYFPRLLFVTQTIEISRQIVIKDAQCKLVFLLVINFVYIYTKD